MTVHNRKRARQMNLLLSSRKLHQISLLILLCFFIVYTSGKSDFALK